MVQTAVVSPAPAGLTSPAEKVVRVPVAVERMDIRHMDLRIVGISPLVVHAWSPKAKKKMLDDQMKRGKQAKEAKDPEQDYRDSMYYLPDGTPAFPVVGVKASAIRGAKSLGLVMADMRAGFFIDGELVPINGSPQMREDMVRVGMGKADIRYRAEFVPWSMDLTLDYNARVCSMEQLVAMFESGGFGTGIGEHRPEKGGDWGRYRVGGASDLPVEDAQQ